MMPTLTLGSLAVPTYPLFLLIAYWAGLWLAARQADRFGVDGDHVYNAGLYGLLAGIVGARLWFVLSHWENYAANLSQALSLSRSALSLGEGFVIAGVVVLIYLQRSKVPLERFLDAIAYGLALAVIIINIGAFLGGEAVGVVTERPWAIKIAGVARHPVQLYEAATSLAILGVLFFISYNPWSGFKFWVFVLLYSASRLMVEIFRARPQIIGDGYLAVQVLALIAMLISLTVMAYHFSRDTTTSSETL